LGRLGSALVVSHAAEPAPEVLRPGGGVDPGEQPLGALHREVYEETGWTLAGARRLGAFRRFTYMPEYDLWAEKVCTIYLARPGLRLGPPSEVGHVALWLPLSDAADLLDTSGDRLFVRRLLRAAR